MLLKNGARLNNCINKFSVEILFTFELRSTKNQQPTLITYNFFPFWIQIIIFLNLLLCSSLLIRLLHERKLK